MNVIIAKSDGRTGASGRRTGDPATWCWWRYSACQLRVSCLATRAVARSPSGQHRQLRGKRSDRSDGRQGGHK
jgi:hypothetical protein